MGDVSVLFLGAGDAFGTAGLFQTCIFVESATARFLIDCGASSLIAMKRFGVDPNDIDLVLLSHLHGDHFGGLPFLVLDGQFAYRTRPLVIAGPPGVEQRVRASMEVFFPGSSEMRRAFPLEFVELTRGASWSLNDITVEPFEALHASGAPSYSLRVRCDGCVIAYSGDGEWSDALLSASAGADLFICEAYSYAKRIRHHLDYLTLMANRSRLTCNRLLLVHLGPDMIAHGTNAGDEWAVDGTKVNL